QGTRRREERHDPDARGAAGPRGGADREGERMSGPVTYGYLGPAGTFTQMALERWRLPEGGAQRSFGSVDAALEALRRGEIAAAMVPIENSVEGGVSATLDALAHGEPLVVVGEVLVPITFVLATRPGVTLDDVHRVGTHSHAWAQVR